MIQNNEVKVFLDEIDFDNFDKVISREIIAEKEPEQEIAPVESDFSDIMISDDEIEIPDDLSMEDLPPLGEADEVEIEAELNDCTDGGEGCENTPAKETEEEKDEEKPIEEAKHLSLTQIYESRRMQKRNKLVEALLVDNTVDSIERVIKSTLNAYGISKAEAIVTMGLILDHLMNSSDDDIVAPEYLGDTIGQVVEDKDVAKIITKEVEEALLGKEPEKVEAKIVLPDGVEDMVAKAE